MNYTQHYQLPQWVETDRIMMDDFNDLTAKLDSGLQQLVEGTPLAKLDKITASAARQALDVSGTDWDKYRALHIYFDLQFAASDVTGMVLLNNQGGNSDYLLSSSNMQNCLCSFSTSYATQCTGVLQLMPGGSGFLGTLDCVGHYPSHGQASCQAVNANTLTTVDFILSAAPTAGSYTLYGLLK